MHPAILTPILHRAFYDRDTTENEEKCMLNFTKALNTEKRKPGPGNRGDRVPGHTIETVTCQVRSLLKESRLDACRQMILDLMRQYPDAAQPHNLMGLLLKRKDRISWPFTISGRQWPWNPGTGRPWRI